MIALLGMLGGAVVRYLPNAFGFLGEWFKNRQEAQREAAAIALQIDLERVKAAGQYQQAKLEGEIAEALAQTQGALEEIRATLSDRQAAREYGSRLQEALTRLLEIGGRMGLPKWFLAGGWALGVTVEAFAASVQPGIAAAGFAGWLAWKAASFWLAGGSTGNPAAGLVAIWGEQDWILLDSIMGFFLAGRAMKHTDARRQPA